MSFLCKSTQRQCAGLGTLEGTEPHSVGHDKKKDNATFKYGQGQRLLLLEKQGHRHTDTGPLRRLDTWSSRKGVGRGGSWETRRDQGRTNDMETSPLPGKEEGLRGILPIRLRLLSRVWKMTQEGLVSLLGGLSQSWSQI